MQNAPLWSPQDIVVRFLEAVADDDIVVAERLLAPDVTYRRSIRRSIKGREAVAEQLRGRRGATIEIEHAADDDSVVLTERRDRIEVATLRLEAWVCGRFEVADGRIIAWRDYCDYRSVVTEAAGAAVGNVVGGLARVGRLGVAVKQRGHRTVFEHLADGAG